MSQDDDARTMKPHRRFTLTGEGDFERDPPGLRGDPNGMWTTYRHLEERAAAERAACAELVRSFDSDDLARMFHEAYEDIAPRFGYETRPDSRKAWTEVPDKNRCLMRATVSKVAWALAAAIEARK